MTEQEYGLFLLLLALIGCSVTMNIWFKFPDEQERDDDNE
jgi:hypothetical protein